MQNAFFYTTSKQGTPELYRDWTQKAKCEDDDRQLLNLACEAFEQRHEEPQGGCCLQAILTAAKHKRRAVWEIGSLMLSQLAQQYSDARDLLLELATSRSSVHRLRAIADLTDDFPREFCVDIVRSSIGDRSEVVAHAASWMAVHLNLKELAPVIATRTGSIKLPIRAEEMRMNTDLLQQEYHEYENENGYNVVFAFSDLFPSQVIWPGGVERGDIEKQGLQSVAARVRACLIPLDSARTPWKWKQPKD
ncbi:MAG: hypothetical protein Aurels2KO_57740 [Aureliella sp.]